MPLAAFTSFAIAFTAGFAFGAVRVLLLVPRLGPVLAVMCELPIMITATWFAVRTMTRRFAVPPDAGPRLAMGLIAFATLMLVEPVLAVLAFKQDLARFFQDLATVQGALGLAGQSTLAIFPWLQGRLAR